MAVQFVKLARKAPFVSRGIRLRIRVLELHYSIKKSCWQATETWQAGVHSSAKPAPLKLTRVRHPASGALAYYCEKKGSDRIAVALKSKFQESAGCVEQHTGHWPEQRSDLDRLQ